MISANILCCWSAVFEANKNLNTSSRIDLLYRRWIIHGFKFLYLTVTVAAADLRLIGIIDSMLVLYCSAPSSKIVEAKVYYFFKMKNCSNK